ncbi:hypothetical protein YPPY46_2130, partial [Yersinia pestis PY-46]
MLLGMADGAV